MEGALFFYNKKAFVAELIPAKPIGILFITSLRDIALKEYNGQFLNIDGEDHYIKGVIENTLEEVKTGGILEGLIEVKGVIVDDMETDLKGKFPLLPTNNSSWIFPTALLSEDRIWNIPSSFRKLKISDTEGRRKAKHDFERRVLAKAQEIGADVIISDSYMARIDHLHSFRSMLGKVLNIHPGPTLLDSQFCFRGSDPIRDAILFAKKNGGPIYTGATLHFVSPEIDGGNCIAYICNTPVCEEDNELKLMHQNYLQAKLPIFVLGLQHYALNIFPYL